MDNVTRARDTQPGVLLRDAAAPLAPAARPTAPGLEGWKRSGSLLPRGAQPEPSTKRLNPTLPGRRVRVSPGWAGDAMFVVRLGVPWARGVVTAGISSALLPAAVAVISNSEVTAGIQPGPPTEEREICKYIYMYVCEE